VSISAVVPARSRVRLSVCVDVKFEGGRIAHEHIYWDHASLLVQVGLLDPAGLPVTGADQAENLLDRRARPMNELMGERR